MIRRSSSAPARRLRRTAVLTAGALLAGAPLLAACGTPHAGAAAVVGDEQITVGTLQSQVNEVRDAQGKLDNAEQILAQGGNLSNATLFSMILDRVVQQAAQDAGVEITRAELQDFRRRQEVANGGAETLNRLLLERQGVTAGDIDRFFRTELTVQKLAEEQGADLRTPEGLQKIGELLGKTSKELGVDVNPRYGEWNAEELTIKPTEDGWLHKPVQGA